MAFVDSILGPTGLIAQKLAGFEERPQQLEMAHAVEDAMFNDRHLVVEAGTGVGKSFAYLVPAIQRALKVKSDERPVVISTGTIALQEQLMGKDIPFLRSVWGEEFTAVLAKGRGNYISLRRMDAALKQQSGGIASDEMRELTRIKSWSESTADGSRSSMGFEPSGEVWQQVVSDRNNCMGRQCPNFEARCFYQRAKRRMYQASVLIVNHALLCADLALKAAGVNYLPDYRYAIIDEAHDLERYASEHMGIRVTRAGLQFVLSQIYNARRDKGVLARFPFLNGAHEALRHARDSGDQFFLEIERWAHRAGRGPVRVQNAELFPPEAAQHLRELAMRLKEGMLQTKNEEERLDIEANINRVLEYADGMDAFNRQSLEGQVYWVEIQQGAREQNIELRAAPVNVGPRLRELLFDRCKSVVLTSATLATGPADFKYCRRRLGVPDENVSELQVGSPFAYKERVQIVVPPEVPEPPKAGGNDPEYERRINEEVENHIRRSRGGTFVLFTSHQQMRKVYDAIRAKLELLGFTVLRQGDGMSRVGMLERFKEGRKMVLFGAETFWQGVDVPGEALTTVILVRLPFPVPSDPLVAARMEEVRKRGASDFNDYMVPEATIKLRQGFGRLIRRKDDFGTVVILDSRVVKKGYGKRILKALPECPITDGKGGDPFKKKAAANPFEL